MKSNRPEPWSKATYREAQEKEENPVKVTEEEWPLITGEK